MLQSPDVSNITKQTLMTKQKHQTVTPSAVIELMQGSLEDYQTIYKTYLIEAVPI
ncbi:hypothetical protein DPMN_160305 [Dreissena polymorpha]|uniref:Uncharacterized protein n=1 Tax=Dreissena polymorpha TaxID=45954 RepID=A0A9D4IQ02_DREPO|nr:hypothetical protein DPMN_160305 [Dreissena polymorpha]